MSNVGRVAAQAANTLTTPLNVEDVFSTYLYTGNGSTQTITNGIDLDGEGGLVWGKTRTTSTNHYLYDTERGIYNLLASSSTGAQANLTDRGVSAFNSDGFDIKGAFDQFNNTGQDYASWTFRKAPKFFDVVTWTGNSGTRTISHNLNGNVGTIIIKKTSGTGNWYVIHRAASGGFDGWGKLNLTDAFSSTGSAISNVTSTSFDIGTFYNNTGIEWVAYLFAHNDGDGEFGPNGDADIIKCGSYTGTGAAGNFVDLGFEPQWLMIKNTTSSSTHWVIFDVMRGMPVGNTTTRLAANLSDAETTNTEVTVMPTGFTPTGTGSYTNKSGGTYIYIAIRRGPMAVPESGTEVFDVTANSGAGAGTSVSTGFPVDATLVKCRNTSSTSTEAWDRLRGQRGYLFTDSTAAEGTAFSSDQWLVDDMDGFTWAAADGFSNLSGRTYVNYSWKRAPGFFDVVAYTGNGVRGRTVSHNLGVVPEMMWIKNRDDAQNWLVYIHSLGGTKKLYLNTTAAAATASIDDFNNTDAEATQFTLGNDGRCNANNQDFIAYLFASLDGVSKVGSYTGTGAAQNIDCGFTNGARFVLIKGSSFADNWWVFDTERGIVTGDDPRLYLNTTNAEFSFDYIDPYSSGFAVTDFLSSNSQTYIYYAIA